MQNDGTNRHNVYCSKGGGERYQTAPFIKKIRLAIWTCIISFVLHEAGFKFSLIPSPSQPNPNPNANANYEFPFYIYPSEKKITWLDSNFLIT